jgi:hypothetical protein
VAIWLASSPHQGNDFQLVPFVQWLLFVPGTRHQLAISLDGDVARLDLERSHQVGDGGALRHVAWFPVERDLHWASG